MQAVRKKKHPSSGRRRLWMLAAAVALLAGIVLLAMLMQPEDKSDWPTYVSTSEDLFSYDPSEVLSITVRRGSDDPWTVVQQESGLLALTGEAGFPLDSSVSAALLDTACLIPCENVLTADPAEYRDHLADFGLDHPRHEAVITYSDGVTAQLSIGDPGSEGGWYYMTVAGDDRLFSFSKGMVDALFVSQDSLRAVVSPTIHKARIDRVTLTSPGATRQWSLEGDITDTDAADKWRITAPISYPADADAMSSLLSNLANLRLGAYVGPATEEALVQYGFDDPRLTIDIHMAAGAIGVTNEEGAVEAADWPEGTVTFVIGGAKSDMVDYVRYGDDIYVSSHFTMGLFIDYDVAATMNRYLVLTALGNLGSLTIQQNGVTVAYVLTRTEQVAANNELITDEEGNPVYDIAVTRDGEAIDYTAFEAAYNVLTLVTVSGALPDGQASTAEPHTLYTFTDVDGTVHTVALADFDALHDAVEVDGHRAFYLIKGGFALNLQ